MKNVLYGQNYKINKCCGICNQNQAAGLKNEGNFLVA
jgi:hypothetical protein